MCDPPSTRPRATVPSSLLHERAAAIGGCLVQSHRGRTRLPALPGHPRSARFGVAEPDRGSSAGTVPHAREPRADPGQGGGTEPARDRAADRRGGAATRRRHVDTQAARARRSGTSRCRSHDIKRAVRADAGLEPTSDRSTHGARAVPGAVHHRRRGTREAAASPGAASARAPGRGCRRDRGTRAERAAGRGREEEARGGGRSGYHPSQNG
jgi:hypothetical protein